MDEQEAFDEAFEELVAEVSLDDVIEKLAAIGVTILPWQREVLATWVDSYNWGVPLAVQVLRLQRTLRPTLAFPMTDEGRG